LVTELRGSGISIAPYHIWAGDLDENFSRVLAGLMAEHLSVDQVYAAPWDTRFRPEYQLRLDVQRFSGALGGDVYMDVLWTLTSRHGRQKLHGERSKLHVSSKGSSYLDYVDALNRLMSVFSADVAVRMEQLLAAANNAEPASE
ncbi:MAG: membrane integrity-associated transporter subunit PqiC, partial [Pseudomonadales bacterium]